MLNGYKYAKSTENLSRDESRMGTGTDLRILREGAKLSSVSLKQGVWGAQAI